MVRVVAVVVGGLDGVTWYGASRGHGLDVVGLRLARVWRRGRGVGDRSGLRCWSRHGRSGD